MKWVKQTMCNINRSIIKNKEVRQLRFYIVMFHTAAYVAVPKLVMYIQAMLCTARWRHDCLNTHYQFCQYLCTGNEISSHCILRRLYGF